MRKVPTVLLRDPDDRAHVLMEVTPGCEWVFSGEARATRKYDGTCTWFDGQDWWARREVKPGKVAPEGFLPVETDEATGKTVGWEPIEQSAFVKFWREAVLAELIGPFITGTFELCGPKINGNPEGYTRHVLMRHDDAEECTNLNYLLSDAGIADIAAYVRALTWEGIVWHHPDGRMAKLKRRDIRNA